MRKLALFSTPKNKNEYQGYRPSFSGQVGTPVSVLIGSAIIAASIYVCYGFSDKLARAIGATSMSVIMRLSSFLLVCIGVQILWNGAKALLITLNAPIQ